MADPNDTPAAGRSMTQRYFGPNEGPGIGAEGGVRGGGQRAAMEFAEMIVDTVREGLLVLDLDLRVQAANESFYRMFRVPREETEGRLVFELGNGQWDLPELRDLLQRILPERHEFNDFEVEHHFEGVGHRMLLLNARRLNHHEMVLLAVEDVTDRQHTEEALRASEARYRTLFESMDQGYCVLEMILDEGGRPVDFRFVEANPAFEGQTGLVDAIGRTARELVPDLEDHWIQAYGRVAETGEAVRFEQGSEAMGRWFDVYASPLGDPESRRVALLFSDVTERKGADEARRESEARYRALFAQAPAFIAVLRGPDHRFEFVNPAYVGLIGDRDFLGRPVRDVLTEFEGQGLFEVLDRVYGEGETFVAVDRPLHIERAGGAERRFVDFVYEPLREPDGSVSGVIALGVDTTDRVLAGERLDRANRELEQRVEARTRQVRALASKLAAAEQAERRRIAHLLHDDLQQQLYGLAMTLAMVSREEADDERDRLLERAAQTVESSIVLARSLATELSPAVLDTDRLDEVLRWLAERKRELFDLEVTVEGDADVPDPSLRTLLYHLVREALFNVVKHAGTDRAWVSLGEADGSVVVEIRDEGTGFDPEALSEDEGAEGFGLSSIRERLEVVGGRFEIESAPGEGARLTMTLPHDRGA